MVTSIGVSRSGPLTARSCRGRSAPPFAGFGVSRVSSSSDISTFSSSVWLQENQSLPSSPSSFAINGKVWVLSSAGKLQPFIRGQSDSFKPEQPIEAQKAQNLVTSIDGDLLAFTDNQTLIYVYQKDGDLRAKYDLGDKKIHDIALDETTNTIYILCHDQKIYKINISD